MVYRIDKLGGEIRYIGEKNLFFLEFYFELVLFRLFIINFLVIIGIGELFLLFFFLRVVIYFVED